MAPQTNSQWEDIDEGEEDGDDNVGAGHGDDAELAWELGIRISEVAGIILKTFQEGLDSKPMDDLVAKLVDSGWVCSQRSPGDSTAHGSVALQASWTSNRQHIAVVLLADVAEGTACLRYFIQRFSRIILPALTHMEPRIRQAAWFATGQLVSNPAYEGDHWSTFVQPLVAPLLVQALAEDSDDEAIINATSNVISACMKQYLKTQPGPVWLAWLEKYCLLCRDAEEACAIGQNMLISAAASLDDAHKVKVKALVQQMADNIKARGINLEDQQAALNALMAAM